MLFRTIVATAAAGLFASAALAAAPAVVNGPGENPACFKPWDANTKHFQWPAKKGPYRIALANGFVGNTWRIQMIKMAKAYAATPEMKSQIKEFKIVSTGTDVAAQIAAIDNFINSGYDAIVTIAVNPTAFAPVIKRANAAGVVLVPFDNVLDSADVMMVNEDQLAMGAQGGDWMIKHIPSKTGKLLEVRGLPGNSVDRDRHLGFRKVVEASGNKFEIVEVVGNLWLSAGDGVHCHAADGTLLGKVLVPETVANLCFGGAKRNRMSICGTTSLYAVYLNTRGV
jgi:ribose transport system substrate-binding protein